MMEKLVRFFHPSEIFQRDGSNQGIRLNPSSSDIDILSLEDPKRLESDVIFLPAFKRLTLCWWGRAQHYSQIKIFLRVRLDDWTPWFCLGQSFSNPPCSSWRWDIDQFITEQSAKQIQLRLHLSIDKGCNPTLDKIIVAMDTDLQRSPENYLKPRSAEVNHPIPFLCQMDQHPTLGNRLCSPTCISMILQSKGVQVNGWDIAQKCYSKDMDLFGIWPFNIHVAYQYGLLGWVEYIHNWNTVINYLEQGYLLVPSIAFTEDQLITPPSYRSTKGHLVVLLGITDDGEIVTHDPRLHEGNSRVWLFRDFSFTWFNHGAVAYVFPPANQPGPWQ